MPIHKVPGGYKWGGKGHVYPTREGAAKQAAAAYANGYKGMSKGGLVKKAKRQNYPDAP
jgi:hypothetical protein